MPSGPLVVVVEWLPPTEASHLMLAAGFPSAASHLATTTDLLPAWTVTALAEFLGLAAVAENVKKGKGKEGRRSGGDKNPGGENWGLKMKHGDEGKR